jgi:hypothetical protein
MATGADTFQLAALARRRYTEEVVKGLVPLVQACIDASRDWLEKPAEHHLAVRRRDLVQELNKSAQEWHRGIVHALRHALLNGVTASRFGEPPKPMASASTSGLSLVDDDTIELEIVTSRLALAVMDRASWEFADLRARVVHLEKRSELEPNDLLRAHVLARYVFESWRLAGLSMASWRELQPVVHEEFALLIEECYHETNHWLVEHGVLQEVDLRPAIRRSRSISMPATSWQGLGSGGSAHTLYTPPPMPADPGASVGQAGNAGGSLTSPTIFARTQSGGNLADMRQDVPGVADAGGQMRHMDHSVAEETRLMTRIGPLARSRSEGEAVLGRLNRLVARQLPGFLGGLLSAAQGSNNQAAGAAAAVPPPVPMSPGLARALDTQQQGLRQRLSPSTRAGYDSKLTTPVLLDELHQRKVALKKAAATPEERATIEIVALLFQSILTEERIPPAVRVWFARLQMPVLRVAVTEPDFFATVDHPARRLIDRMGACVMGFDGGAQAVSEALEKEVKRIVQVVEAYPDTGRRVFQTVLTEFEKFLEGYFKDHNEATKKGVSLAQQVEQRETLAIQFTIELRRMLAEVPVQEGVRQFLFHVWADVLATSAVKHGKQSDETKRMKRAAADLIWSASAKVTREERGEVIRKLPPLLKALKEGMAITGMDGGRQDEQVQLLNNSLAAAFTAKAAAVPEERLQELMRGLETLEELLPEEAEVPIDESMVLDLSGHDTRDLEVVYDGGSMPTPAMLAWARELQVGSWYMLDYNNRNEAVQLAWQGLRKQLALFVSREGRCVLFQQQRLAAFLQAGLLLPAQDESLTVRATRSALAKLDVDGARLLN